MIRGIVGPSTPSRIYPQQPTYQRPTYQPPRTYPVDPPTWQDPNPVVGDTGVQFGGVTYDPFSGQVRVRTDQSKVRESYFDPNRQNIDPGSYRRVDRVEIVNGERFHVTGYEWTSNGQPHGNLSRRSLRQVAPGIVQDKNENVAFSAQRTQQQPRQQQQVQPRHTPQPHQGTTPIRYNPF